MGSAQVILICNALKKCRPHCMQAVHCNRGACCHCINKYTVREQSEDLATQHVHRKSQLLDAPADNLYGCADGLVHACR